MTALAAYEILTAPEGAVSVIRLLDRRLFAALASQHLHPLRRADGGLMLARLQTDGLVEEVLVLDGAEPELHIHGGTANLRRVTTLLDSLSDAGAGDPAAPETRWRSLWETAVGRAHARKALLYLSKLSPGQTDEKNGPWDLEGWEYLRPLRVILAGPVNTGKSSLFNRLLGQARALVSSEPGTTRDLVRATLCLWGWELELQDSAGSGGPDDETGRAAQEATAVALKSADLVVLFTGEPEPPLAPGRIIIPIIPRCDLLEPAQREQRRAEIERRLRRPPLAVSGHTGEGVAELLAALGEAATRLRGGRISPRFAP